MHPVALPRRGRGVDDLLHVPGRDVLAGDRADDRGGEPLAQPALGVRVLAGPLPLDREPVGVQVVRDQVRAGPLHVRRVGFQPLGDLLQLGGQLLLGRRLALLPLAVLVPDRPPAALLLAGRVDRDPALQLDHRAAAPGGRAPGPAREHPPGAVRPAFARRRAGGPAAGRLWGFCGDLGPRGRCLRHGDSLSSCVYAGERADVLGSRDRTRTYNLPVNSRTLCRLSYAGSTRIRVAHLRRARDAHRLWRPVFIGALPDEYAGVMGEGHVCT